MGQSLYAYDLRVEYMREPVGMDEQAPRFSWKLMGAARGVEQSAYRIEVVRKNGDTPDGGSPVWDSAWQTVGECFQIPYAGEMLESSTRYAWRVALKLSDGTELPWSEPAGFITGAVSEDHWSARWISMENSGKYESSESPFVGKLHEYYAMYFRKELVVDKPIKSAVALVSAMGVCELFLNGCKIGDRVLDPAQTDYKRLTLYSAYDITGRIGKRNAFGIILGNGRHIDAYKYDAPKAALQVVLEYEDGGRETFCTDASWKASEGPIRENGFYIGERYDARLEKHGWNLPGYDEGSWSPVKVADGPKPRWQNMEPIRFTARIAPKKITSPDPGVYIVDFGQNFTGVVELSARGKQGETIRLRHAEILDEDGRLNIQVNRGAEATDTYTLKGEGVESYRPRFTYHGFRYCEVTGYPGVPTLESFRGWLMHTDVEPAGELLVSNELVNQVHRNTVWGQKANLMGIPTDCPQRDERMGWLGDAQLVNEEAIYNFWMPSFYTKYLTDIKISQKETGSLSSVVPDYWPIYPTDPAWGSAYLILAWNQYWFYGDRQILERHYDGMRKYVDFLNAESDDLIVRKLGLYGDWCPPGSILPKRTPLELTSTWYFYLDCVLIGRIAGVLGFEKDRTGYLDLAERIKKRFNEEFLKEKNGYRVIEMCPDDGFPGQTSNLLPLALGMVPEEKQEQVVKALMDSVVKHQDYHLDTGIVGTRYLFEVLTDLGEIEAAYKIATRKSYPGWGYMLAEDATTLWERWEKIEGVGMNSGNHIMLGSVDFWFYNTLAGLRCAAPGWQEIEYRPHPAGDLRYAAARVETIRGTAAISWEKVDSRLRCLITVPSGSTGRLSLPLSTGTADDARITESGRPLWGAGTAAATLPPGIREVSLESCADGSGCCLVSLAGGEYEFQVG